jgi:preprotein translocase subunit SecB
MSEIENKENEHNGAGDSAGTVSLAHIFIKDFSFEAPNAPNVIISPETDPEIQLNLKTSRKSLTNGKHEVILHINVHAKAGEKTVFLAEIDQAGIFGLNGFTPDQERRILGADCPATLFPYAREAISSMVIKAGFPAFFLQPINFNAIYDHAAKNTADA